MADRCIFLDELLTLAGGGPRTYELRESVPTGLACLDAQVRVGADWWFARKWVATRSGRRELYRWIDRVEAAGFRFRLKPRPPRPPVGPGEPEASIRASHHVTGLSDLERRIHAELFPEEARLLDRGYDWDAHAVWSAMGSIDVDPWGRRLETDEGVVFEWVRVEDERAWRRYPLERVRVEVRLNPAHAAADPQPSW